MAMTKQLQILDFPPDFSHHIQTVCAGCLSWKWLHRWMARRSMEVVFWARYLGIVWQLLINQGHQIHKQSRTSWFCWLDLLFKTMLWLAQRPANTNYSSEAGRVSDAIRIFHAHFFKRAFHVTEPTTTKSRWRWFDRYQTTTLSAIAPFSAPACSFTCHVFVFIEATQQTLHFANVW